MTSDDWRDWRLEASGLVWRVALPEDAEGLEALTAMTDARYGQQDRPDFFEKPVLLTLVAEDASGVIVDGLYIELVADITKLTSNRNGFAAYPLLLPVIGGFLESRHVRVAQMSVLQRWTAAMAISLKKMGMMRTDGIFSHWVRKVRP